MNYIAEINSFYDKLEINPLSTNAITLWHALMATANKACWIDKFAVAVSVLELKTGLKKKSIERARNELKQKGYIEWKSRTGNQSAEYELFSLCVKYNPQSVSQHVPQGDPQSVSQHVAINKLNKTKEFNIEGKPILISNEFLEVLEQMQVDSIWFEPICMNLGISVSEYHNQLLYFFSLRTNEGAVAYLSLKEAKSHFANWLRIEIAKVKPKPINQKGGKNVTDYTEAI